MVGRTRGKAGRGYVGSPWMRKQLRSGQRMFPIGRGTRTDRQSLRLNLGSNNSMIRHWLKPTTKEHTVQNGTVRTTSPSRNIDSSQDTETNGTHTINVLKNVSNRAPVSELNRAGMDGDI